MKTSNIVFGILFGLAPLFGGALLGISFYAAYRNLIGISIFVVIIVLSAWAGFIIFKKVQAMGPLRFITAIYASSDLDTLEPMPWSKTTKRTPTELVDSIKNKTNTCKGGSIRIFGNQLLQQTARLQLIDASLSEKDNLLTLHFEKGVKLELTRPSLIFEAPTFLKIQNAENVKITWSPRESEKQLFIQYQTVNNEVSINSNLTKPISEYSYSLGEPALMIFA